MIGAICANLLGRYVFSQAYAYFSDIQIDLVILTYDTIRRQMILHDFLGRLQYFFKYPGIIAP